ncbi:PAS domain-containing protein [Bradyrhizobium sp. 2TAF24]|uniref:PAS domain-containing protein n=1 Tax=Bradyrhizobium sp. 2TAF24 TaxID=3233011 RepID=UPI003F8F0A45
MRRLLPFKNSRVLPSIEAMPAHVMMADGDGRVSHLTDAMKQLLAELEPALRRADPGFVFGGVVGRNLFECLDAIAGRKLARDALLDGEAASLLVGERWFELSATRLKDGRDRIIGFAVGWSDSTLQQRARELQARAQAVGRAQATIEFTMDGRVATANDNFFALTGYSPEEIVGQHHSVLVPRAERDTTAHRELWAALNRGEAQSGEFQWLAKADRTFWILATYVPIPGEGGSPSQVLVIATDVTRQKQEAAELAGCMAAISRSQAVIEFDLSGHILGANDNFLRALGYTLEEIRGRHHSMFLDPAESDSVAYRDFWANLGRGSCQSGEFRRIAKGGQDVWIQASYNPVLDSNGRPQKVIKFAMDTTAQVVARKKSEHVRGLMETVAAGAEELNASVSEIADAMVRSRDTVATAVTRVDAADEQAKRLSDAARSMSGIVEFIQEITGQINLLALNATIESARAGEAGRGFSVVAAEVKSLASQTRQATDKISSEIEAMNGISSDVLSSLGRIKSTIEDVSEYVSSTAAAIQQQSAVAGAMSASMQQAAAEAASIGR